MCLSLLIEKFGQPLDTCLVHQSQHSLEITFPLISSEKYCSRVCNMWSISRILQLSEKKGPSYCSSTWVFFNWTFMKCSWRITNSFPWLLPGVPGCLSSVQLLVKSPKNVKNGTNQQIFSTHKSLHPSCSNDLTSLLKEKSFNIISLIESIPYYPILSLSHIMGPIISLIQHHKLASHCSWECWTSQLPHRRDGVKKCLLILPVTAQEGWGQKVHADPPHSR